MSLRRPIIIAVLAAGSLLLPTSYAQDAAQDLPSAPSPASQSRPQAGQTAAPEESTKAGQNNGPSAAAHSANPTPKNDPSNASLVQPAGSLTDAKASADAKAASDAKDSAQDESVATIRKTVNEVSVVFTVTDKHGRYVKDLTKQDFRVVDDNKPPEEIRSFHSETDLPLVVGLLIDASNSVRDRFKFEQESAVEFLNQTVRRKYDKAFVVGFDVTPEVTQDFTDDTEALSVGVRSLRPGGGTAMYDALYFACRDKLLKAPQTGAVRKAVILLSDGEDNQSHVTREEAIEMAQRADVIVYTISTNLSGSSHHGDKVLERIAEATGGRSYVPFQLTDVANAFVAIQEELRSQYAISYKPADFKPDGRYRSIEILAQEKGLHVRSRHGYYAPSQ